MLSLIPIFGDFVSSDSVSVAWKAPEPHIRPKPGSLALAAQLQGINRAPLAGESIQTVLPQFISASTGGQAVVAKCLSVKNSGLFVRVVAVTVANTNQSWGP